MVSEPAPVPEKKLAMIPAAVPALPARAPKAVTAPAVPAVARTVEAPKAVIAHPVMASAPAPEKKQLAANSRVATTAQPSPVIVASAAPKQNEHSSQRSIPVAPVAHEPAKSLFAVIASMPARFFWPQPKQAVPAVMTAAKMQPAKAVAAKTGAIKPAPAMVADATTAASPIPATNWQPEKKVLTIGQPVRLLNASGKASGTGTVLHRLATLGWTMRASDARAQPASVLFYSAQNLAAAKALQRTLPFPVRLTVDKADGSGMRLVIGRAYLSWKPRNPRIAALWQKGAVIASLQKPAIKGVR